MNPHRANIINTLQLIASAEAALEYQAQLPSVSVSRELVNQWFDDFYHPRSPQFKAAFSDVELAELGRFHRFFDERVDALPGELTLMLASPEWDQVSAEAAAMLDRLRWTGLVTRYDD
jgi:hypothetical protein